VDDAPWADVVLGGVAATIGEGAAVGGGSAEAEPAEAVGGGSREADPADTVRGGSGDATAAGGAEVAASGPETMGGGSKVTGGDTDATADGAGDAGVISLGAGSVAAGLEAAAEWAAACRRSLARVAAGSPRGDVERSMAAIGGAGVVAACGATTGTPASRASAFAARWLASSLAIRDSSSAMRRVRVAACSAESPPVSTRGEDARPPSRAGRASRASRCRRDRDDREHARDGEARTGNGVAEPREEQTTSQEHFIGRGQTVLPHERAHDECPDHAGEDARGEGGMVNGRTLTSCHF